MENIEKSDILISVLHLQEASKLLKTTDLDISTTLLLLAKYLIENNGLLTSDINNAKQLIDEISPNEKDAIIHRVDSK